MMIKNLNSSNKILKVITLSNITFTYQSNKESVNFLDLAVSFHENWWSTDLNIKTTSRHQYLHYSSSHPYQTEKSIINSQTSRPSRICFKEWLCLTQERMTLWFLKREYPESVKTEMEKIRFRQRLKGGREVTKKRALVLTYHRLLKSVITILYTHLYLLCIDEEGKKVFFPAPTASF